MSLSLGGCGSSIISSEEGAVERVESHSSSVPVEDRAVTKSRSTSSTPAPTSTPSNTSPRRSSADTAAVVVHRAPAFRPPPSKPLERTSPQIPRSPAAPAAAARASTNTALDTTEVALPSNASSAVVALASRADRSANLEQKAAVLERALRLEPQNAVIWHRLAKVRFAQKRYGQAEAVALRSNALAFDQPDLWPRNWDLIARSRDHLGDKEGAQHARKKQASGRR